MTRTTLKTERISVGTVVWTTHAYLTVGVIVDYEELSAPLCDFGYLVLHEHGIVERWLHPDLRVCDNLRHIIRFNSLFKEYMEGLLGVLGTLEQLK